MIGRDLIDMAANDGLPTMPQDCEEQGIDREAVTDASVSVGLYLSQTAHRIPPDVDVLAACASAAWAQGFMAGVAAARVADRPDEDRS